LVVTTSGAYHVQVTDSNGCSSFDTIVVGFFVLPEVDLGTDTAISAGQTITLDAGNPGLIYLWSTGDTIQQITIANAGVYSVVVTDEFGCQGYDEIAIAVVSGIGDVGNSLSVNIFPNPANEIINILVSDGVGDLSPPFRIEVYNLLGQKVYDWNGESAGQLIHKIPVSVWANGQYIVRVVTGEAAITRSVVIAE
jgi:hypothetical protein